MLLDKTHTHTLLQLETKQKACSFVRGQFLGLKQELILLVGLETVILIQLMNKLVINGDDDSRYNGDEEKKKKNGK